MDKEYFEVCLCSLLHDIGKFAWRVKDESEGFLPKGKRRCHEDMNKEIVGTGGRDYKIKISFSYWSKVNQPLNNCVWLGDWISAQERDDLDELGKKEAKKEELERVKRTPLIGSFCLVDLKKQNRKLESNIEKIYIKHRNLSLNLPSKEDFLIKKELIKHKFEKQLFNQFKAELKKILSIDIDAKNGSKLRIKVLREVLDLLRKYLIYIPSATAYSESDIDLFNHSKISCAITACLYKLYKSDEKKYTKFLQDLRREMSEIFRRKLKIERVKDKAKKKEGKEKLKEYKKDKNKNPSYNEKIFILVRGDFSGIQDFISTLSTGEAIKHLKARSFYLAFLNRLIPLAIIREIDLPEANIIFADGGNFEILVPNLKSVKKKVDSFIDSVNKHFFNLFGTKIFLSISFVKLSSKDIDRDFFSQRIKEFFEEKKEKINPKQKKFFEILKDIIDEEGNQNLAVGQSECEICYNEIFEKTQKKCGVCKMFEKIRDDIKEWQKGEWFLEKNKKEQKRGESKIKKISSPLFKIGNKDLFNAFGYYSLTKDNTLIQIFPFLNKIKGIYEIFSIGVPLDRDGKIIDFDTLAEKAKARTGTKKIAALKLDVDNLGNIFSKGFEENLILSLYSRLSFDFNLFFSGIVEKLREDDKFKEEIYIIYAGGDDTFIIGSWDKVLEFAKELIKYFRIYVNKHPNITISASYNLFSPKYPVKKIFEIMEDELSKAKNFSNDIFDKSRVSMFGIPIKWDIIEEDKRLNKELINEWLDNKKINEFELVWILQSYLNNLLENGKVTRTFLSKIIFLSDEILAHLAEKNLEVNLIPMYRFTYYLKRVVKEESKDFKILNELWEKFCFADINKRFKNESNSFSKNIKKLELLKIATKIVLLKTRK